MNGRMWTQAEDEYLVNNYPYNNTIHVAEFLNRSIPSIAHRARSLGLVKTKEAYDKARAEAFKKESREINNLPIEEVPLNKAYMSEEWLRDRYVELEYSSIDIANMVGVEKSTILTWLKYYDIERRNIDEITDRTRVKISTHASQRRGEQVGRWNGGQTVNENGYRYILMPDHPNANGNGYVAEHRLVMEFVIARLLDKKEVVHHRDGNRLNNFVDNLFLFPNSSIHAKFHSFKRFHEPNITEEEYMKRFYANSYPDHLTPFSSM